MASPARRVPPCTTRALTPPHPCIASRRPPRSCGSCSRRGRTARSRRAARPPPGGSCRPGRAGGGPAPSPGAGWRRVAQGSPGGRRWLAATLRRSGSPGGATLSGSASHPPGRSPSERWSPGALRRRRPARVRCGSSLPGRWSSPPPRPLLLSAALPRGHAGPRRAGFCHAPPLSGEPGEPGRARVVCSRAARRARLVAGAARWGGRQGAEGPDLDACAGPPGRAAQHGVPRMRLASGPAPTAPGGGPATPRLRWWSGGRARAGRGCGGAAPPGAAGSRAGAGGRPRGGRSARSSRRRGCPR